MRHALLIVSHAIVHQPFFQEYLLRHVRRALPTLHTLAYLRETDMNLFVELQSYLEDHDQILIATTKRHYPTVAKLLATLLEDTLIYKDGLLLPSKASTYADSSFMVEFGKKRINLFQIAESKTLPEILLTEEPKEALLHLFFMDEESARILLTPLAESHNVILHASEYIRGWSLITAKSSKFGELSTFITGAKALFPDKLIASHNLVSYIIERLYTHGRTLSFAESCTGGALAALFTQEAGASSVFHGSVVAYANTIKQHWLHVEEESLRLYGAVSEQTVQEMLEGILTISGADYALAISGVAGPGGGSEGKPVGTIFVGAKRRNHPPLIERVLLQGDRQYIQAQAVRHALLQLLQTARDDLF